MVGVVRELFAVTEIVATFVPASISHVSVKVDAPADSARTGLALSAIVRWYVSGVPFFLTPENPTIPVRA